MDTNGKSSLRGRCILIFVVGAGLPANRSKANVREIIVPVPTCVVFEDTVVSREAVGPVPMERQHGHSSGVAGAADFASSHPITLNDNGIGM